jgi:hypothetical protein
MYAKTTVELIESAAHCCLGLECCGGITLLTTSVNEPYEEDL